jgi:carbonic anhydrase/acetyltransferase-like protein (isoleucine patch superfamily)
MFAMKLVAAGAASFGGALFVGVLAGAGKEVKRSGDDLVRLQAEVDSLKIALAEAMPARGFVRGRPNVETDFNEDIERPVLDPTSFIDPLASVLGHVQLGKHVYVAPGASIRGDEGQPIFLAEGTNVQDGVVIHALETVQEGKAVPGRTYNVGGKDYAVYVGKRVSLAHQALVHGPARVDDNVFVGMQAMVFKAAIGEGVVIEPGAKVIGVTIAPRRYVPAGQTITDQRAADNLPQITEGYAFRGLNEAVVNVNTSFARGYNALAKEAEAAVREKSKSEGAAGESGHRATEKKTDKAPAEKKEH